MRSSSPRRLTKETKEYSKKKKKSVCVNLQETKCMLIFDTFEKGFEDLLRKGCERLCILESC